MHYIKISILTLTLIISGCSMCRLYPEPLDINSVWPPNARGVEIEANCDVWE